MAIKINDMKSIERVVLHVKRGDRVEEGMEEDDFKL